MPAERVTVLDLMAQAAESTPPPQVSGVSDQVSGMGVEERIEFLTAQLEKFVDPREREVAEELVSAVLQVHGEGLARVLEIAGEETARKLADDPDVGSMLLIHDLYPVPLEERVAEALESVRPYMESHGGDVELLGIEDGVARLRLEGSCRGCAASSATLELAIKQALMDAAPDLLGMDVEGVEDEPTHDPPVSGTPLPQASQVPELSGWTDLDGVASLEEGVTSALQVGDSSVLVANVNGTLLAYRDRCAACDGELHDGALTGSVLACPSCSARFDLPRAGRSADDDSLQLAPIPLLRDGAERVRIAL